MGVDLFWFVAILLLCLVSAAILWPLLGPGRPATSRAAHDVEVYAAQLRELRGDAARGTIAPDEAANAKAEIGRRLLRASDEAGRDTAAGRPGAASRRSGIAFASLTLALIAAVSLGTYAVTGAPTRPDMPLSARLAVDPRNADIDTLVAQAEARLQAEPDDGRGWETLLPIYLRIGRAEDAVKAADNAIRLLGSTAEREAMRGEALTQAAAGQVTDAAREAFDKTLRLDPAHPAARFFLAVGFSQRADFASAATAWKDILDRGPPNAPWMGTARQGYEEARRNLDGANQPGPSAEQVAAAAGLSDGDRTAMIDGMIAQLAERLKSAPKDADGWRRLMRSYAVLGRTEEARETYMQARSVFAEGTPERGSIDGFAQELGLGDEKAVR